MVASFSIGDRALTHNKPKRRGKPKRYQHKGKPLTHPRHPVAQRLPGVFSCTAK